MTDEITFFKVLLYKHANEANALLRANYDGLETAIVRYLSFIDKEPLIQAFICDCVQEHLPRGLIQLARLTKSARNMAQPSHSRPASRASAESSISSSRTSLRASHRATLDFSTNMVGDQQNTMT